MNSDNYRCPECGHTTIDSFTCEKCGHGGVMTLHVRSAMTDRETYLGDAVYASFDGYQIWLRTGDGNNQRIALDPGVFDALIRYAGTLRAPPPEKTP